MHNSSKNVTTIMGSIALTAGAAGAVEHPAQLSSDTDMSMKNIEQSDLLREQAKLGKLRPGEVAEAMRDLGIGLIDTPVSDVLSDNDANPSASKETPSLLICNNNWCIVVQPVLAQQSSGPESTSANLATHIADRFSEVQGSTLGDVLDELDNIAEKDEHWQAVLGDSGKVFVS